MIIGTCHIGIADYLQRQNCILNGETKCSFSDGIWKFLNSRHIRWKLTRSIYLFSFPDLFICFGLNNILVTEFLFFSNIFLWYDCLLGNYPWHQSPNGIDVNCK